MKKGILCPYFDTAWKRLSLVEISKAASNQREVHGSIAIQELLGLEKLNIDAKYYWFETGKSRWEHGKATWYDSRKDQPNRSPEFRLYYTNENTAIEPANVADILVLAWNQKDELHFLCARQSSIYERALVKLFDLKIDHCAHFSQSVTDLAGREIMNSMGINIPDIFPEGGPKNPPELTL